MASLNLPLRASSTERAALSIYRLLLPLPELSTSLNVLKIFSCMPLLSISFFIAFDIMFSLERDVIVSAIVVSVHIFKEFWYAATLSPITI